MATLAEFRTQNPQYNDMPDAALADALHGKYYSDVPRGEFFKQLGVASAQIPGAENVTSLPPKPVSMQDRVMGLIETPAIMAGQVGRMVATPFAQMIGEAYGGYGTPQGKEMGQKAAQVTSQQFYQPRTETGPDIVNQIGKALAVLPPTLGSTGTTLNALTPAAVSQTRAMVTPVATSTQQRMAALLQPQKPQMVGMGAASTNPALMRQERALRQDIPLTKGEQFRSQQTENISVIGILYQCNPALRYNLLMMALLPQAQRIFEPAQVDFFPTSGISRAEQRSDQAG